MENTLIFLIAVTIAALLFTSFSTMVKKSAKAHEEEELRERQREARMRLGRAREMEMREAQRIQAPAVIQLDDSTIRWHQANSYPQQSESPKNQDNTSSIEEYEE